MYNKSEDRASHTLRRMGYKILARNHRTSGAEFDILALKGENYHLFEIKQIRQSNLNIYPIIGKTQQNRQFLAIQRLIDADKEISIIPGLIIYNENNEILDFNPGWIYR